MARNAKKKGGGGLGTTGRDNGLALLRKKKKTGKTGSTNGTGKGRADRRRNSGKRG